MRGELPRVVAAGDEYDRDVDTAGPFDDLVEGPAERVVAGPFECDPEDEDSDLLTLEELVVFAADVECDGVTFRSSVRGAELPPVLGDD